MSPFQLNKTLLLSSSVFQKMFPWSFGILSTRTSMNKSTSNRPSPSCSCPRRSTAELRPCWPRRRGPRPITPPCCSSSSRKVSLPRSWMQTSPRRTSATSPSRRWVCRLVWSVVHASVILHFSNLLMEIAQWKILLQWNVGTQELAVKPSPEQSEEKSVRRKRCDPLLCQFLVAERSSGARKEKVWREQRKEKRTGGEE